jgi:hypothetical protein
MEVLPVAQLVLVVVVVVVLLFFQLLRSLPRGG